ncbi:SlyX family protein [Sagittula sp. NFXS13]|uniref:SlyX family protein n=1 Tax=Sagittula sp. NFXS13 TaxID=2819095 RepID=UPI0032DF10A1
MSDRTQEMEEQVAHLYKTVEELSDVIAKQDMELRALTQRVDLLVRREADRQSEAPGAAIFGDERPPHY